MRFFRIETETSEWRCGDGCCSEYWYVYYIYEYNADGYKELIDIVEDSEWADKDKHIANTLKMIGYKVEFGDYDE